MQFVHCILRIIAILVDNKSKSRWISAQIVPRLHFNIICELLMVYTHTESSNRLIIMGSVR